MDLLRLVVGRQAGLTRKLSVMRTLAGGDVWVVALEPSCPAALRKDLPKLIPDDATGRRK